MKDSWPVRTTADQRLHSHILAPNQWGKYDIWVRTDAFADQPDLLDGVNIKPVRRPDEPIHSVGLAHVRLGSNFAPRVSLEPLNGYVVSVGQLEDAWLREHALASSLRRPMRLGKITLTVSRIDLRNSRWFDHTRGFTHALGLQSVTVHEVLP